MYTGCWFDKLPAGYVKIGVSRGTPRGMQQTPNIRQLNPGPYFRTASTKAYHDQYLAGLEPLDPADIVAKIDAVSRRHGTPVLCCYERFGSGDWCHRGYVSAWLADTLGLIVPEFNDPAKAFGWHHPLIPAEYRHSAIPVGNRPRPGRK